MAHAARQIARTPTEGGTRGQTIPDSRVLSFTAITLEPVWTCTNSACVAGGGVPFTGPGPTCFGYRTVKLASGETKRVRQPQCRPCRAEAAKSAKRKAREKKRKEQVRQNRSVGQRLRWQKKWAAERQLELELVSG